MRCRSRVLRDMLRRMNVSTLFPGWTGFLWIVAMLVVGSGCGPAPTEGVLPGGPPGAVLAASSPLEVQLVAGDLPPQQTRLRLGIVPTIGSEAVRERYEPMADFFSSLLGVQVTLVVGDSYSDLVDRFVNGEADLAILPPLSFLAAQDRLPSLQPVVSKVAYGTPSYSAFLVVRADDPIQEISRLRGRRVGFVHRQSTSGFLFPYVALLDAGLDPRNDFSEVLFLGSHPEAVAALANGRVDVIGTSSGVQDSLAHALRQGRLKTAVRLRILHKAGRIPYDVMAASPDMPLSGLQRIREVLLSLNTLSPMGRDIWRITDKITGWMPYDDARYDLVRRTQQRVLSHQEQMNGVRDGD